MSKFFKLAIIILLGLNSCKNKMEDVIPFSPSEIIIEYPNRIEILRYNSTYQITQREYINYINSELIDTNIMIYSYSDSAIFTKSITSFGGPFFDTLLLDQNGCLLAHEGIGIKSIQYTDGYITYLDRSDRTIEASYLAGNLTKEIVHFPGGDNITDFQYYPNREDPYRLNSLISETISISMYQDSPIMGKASKNLIKYRRDDQFHHFEYEFDKNGFPNLVIINTSAQSDTIKVTYR